MKLGKLAAQHRAKLNFGDYLRVSPRALVAQLPKAPDSGDWEAKLPDSALQMWGNDQYGCCAFAAQANAQQTFAAQRGEAFNLTTGDVLSSYSRCTGFRAGDPSTDRGTVMADALDDWQNEGIGGLKIVGHVAVDYRNWAQVCLAQYLFGGVYFGAQLPISAQQPGAWAGKTGALEGTDTPGSWGGHAIWSPTWTVGGDGIITWQRRQPADKQWWYNYVDESYAVLSPNWADVIVGAPNGIDIASLAADLAAVGN